MKKLLAVAIALSLSGVTLKAQSDDINPIITGAPSLTIAPDARSGGMGDAGVASTPDVYSQYWNPSKYAFATKKWGVGTSYTPWLRKVVNDMSMMQIVGYYKLGNSDNQALSTSIRYFDSGDALTSDKVTGEFMHNISPYELAIDVGYARKLTNTFSASVAIKHIRVDHNVSTDEGSSAGNAFAADISGYNESYVRLFNRESLLSFGFNISNIGAKISNGNQYKSFLPTNLRLGTALMQPIDDVNTLSVSLDLNKLLVPTPPLKGKNDEEYDEAVRKYNEKSPISGIFKSFGDGSFSEEMKEISISMGAEYMYKKLFMLRTGYFHENKYKGNRQYMTFGAGARWQYLHFDMAYVLATKTSNPLNQTLRFSLSVEM